MSSRKVRLRVCNLRSSLVNLPPILASQLSSQGILPQSLGIELRQIGKLSSKESDRPLFVGWSGLTTLPSHERFPNPKNSVPRQGSSLWSNSAPNGVEFIESIELDEALAFEMDWKEDDRLSIKFHHHGLIHATSVSVEPLTIDDWEILESNPQYLEENILKQTRVLTESQKLFIWVYEKTLIQVKIKSILPPATNIKADRSSVPYLITNESEIAVCPKTRFDSSVQDSNQKNQVLGEFKVPDTAARKKKNSPVESKRLEFKILPHAFSINLVPKDSLSLSPGSIIKMQDQANTQDDCYPIAVLNPTQFSHFESVYPSTLCSLRLLLRPTQASNSQSTLTSTAPVPPGQGSTKNSKLNKKQTPHTFAQSSIADRVRIIPHAEVPIGFIYLSFQFKQKWFASFPSGLDPRSSLSIGRTGDYEYISIGIASDISSESNQSDLDWRAPSDERDVTENKPESIMLLGFKDHMDFCTQFLQTSLVTGQLFALGKYRSGNHNLAGLMICGSSGSGKTSLVKTLIEKSYLYPEMMMYSRYIDCGRHVDDRLSVLKSNFTEWFDDAAWHSPSLLVLDDLDQLLPAEAEHIDSFRYRHFVEEFISIANMATKDRLVVLVATCSSSASLHNLLRSGTHVFAETLELKGLNRTNRQEILSELIKLKAERSGVDVSHIQTAALSTEKTEGYLPSDLKDLVDRAVHQAIIRSLKTANQGSPVSISLKMADFESAQSGFVPISLRDIKLQKSSVNWSDIGGLTEARRVLRETLEWPTKYPAIFSNCPLRLRSGLLLYGYPGCGKTLLASAIAKECGLNFISIKGPELLNKYIGASEQSVRDLFERAQAAKPCVLFFDEFESIAPKRGHDSTGVTDRVVNQLLTQMDGAEGLEGVYVLAATSRPDLIDPALLRPGRLDKSLLCSMPTFSERLDILKAVSRQLPLADDLSWEEVAEYTEGFTGADLQALIYSAHLEVVHESINSKTSLISENGENGDHGNSSSSLPTDSIDWIEIQPHERDSLKFAERDMKSRAEKEAITKRIEQVLHNTTLGVTNSDDLSRNIASNESPVQSSIGMRHLRSALRNARASVPAKELSRLTKIYRNFVSSRSDGGLPGGESSEEIGGRASLM